MNRLIKFFQAVLFALAFLFVLIFLLTQITMFGIIGYASMIVGSAIYLVIAVSSVVRRAKQQGKACEYKDTELYPESSSNSDYP